MSRRQVTVRLEDRVACERCEVADDPMTRMRGLLGRSELPRGEGVLLRPARSVHTFFMRFPIDVVFLDGDGTVLDVVRELRPWRAAGAKGSHAVLELASGEAGAHGIDAGARLVFDPEPTKIAVPFREAAQTLSEYVVVLFVISATIMTTIAIMSGVVATLISLAASVFPSS